MTIELQILAWTVVLGFVHIIAASSAATKQRGLSWNLSARDQPVAVLNGLAGRLERAQRNFFETFPLFAALILAVQLAGKNGPMSELGAILYLAARVIYVPLYALGIPIVRTLSWSVSIVGMAILVKLLLSA